MGCRLLDSRYRSLTTQIVIVLACTCAAIYFARLPTIPDIAWLIEASRRWLRGAVLYRDIIEVNPPLIFYETVALSAGFLDQTAFKLGVCVLIALSAFWCLRLQCPRVALSALAAMLIGGMTDFGQRDHLALIFVIPFLLGESGRPPERLALGLFAFLGVALKPYFVPIPLAALLVRAALSRSLRPFGSAEALALTISCLAYVGWIIAVHPLYFRYIVPLGREVYWTYRVPPVPTLTYVSFALVLTCAIPLVKPGRLTLQLAAACLAALLSFYLQGRNYTYHFVPAMGLGILLALMLPYRAGIILSALFIGVQLVRGGQAEQRFAPIPDGTSSVAILSAHVFAAYPSTLNRGIRNVSRYPALWTLPGAWRLHDDRLLAEQRSIIRGDILRDHPELIIADARPWKPYFNGPFDYMAFLGPFPGYCYTGASRQGVFVYAIYRVAEHVKYCRSKG